MNQLPICNAPLTLEQRMALIGVAKKAQKCARIPLSDFAVGAAILCKSGKIYGGCNVEVTQTGGLCAEENAIANAITMGEHLLSGRRFVRAVAIITANAYDKENVAHCAPCGICRQVINDCTDAHACEIVFGNDCADVFKLSDFFPYGFSLDSRENSDLSLIACEQLENETAQQPSMFQLMEAARKITGHALTHSLRHQREGAAILTTQGKVFCGVSLENSNTNHYRSALSIAINRAIVQTGVRGKNFSTGQFVQAAALLREVDVGVDDVLPLPLLHDFFTPEATLMLTTARETKCITKPIAWVYQQ